MPVVLLSILCALFSAIALADGHLKSELEKQAKQEVETLKQAEKVNVQKQRKKETVVGSNIVVLKTNRGDVVIELAAERAPISVENFKQYVASGFYDNTIFHRVIPGFMIQGGGFEEDEYGMSKKTTLAPIKNEADNGLSNITGSIAMARTSNPDSGTAQFFINVNDNKNLNHTGKNPRGWGYAVFGQVVEGLDVVMAISKEKTDRKNEYSDVPVETVVIEKAVFRE